MYYGKLEYVGTETVCNQYQNTRYLVLRSSSKGQKSLIRVELDKFNQDLATLSISLLDEFEIDPNSFSIAQRELARKYSFLDMAQADNVDHTDEQKENIFDLFERDPISFSKMQRAYAKRLIKDEARQSI